MNGGPSEDALQKTQTVNDLPGWRHFWVDPQLKELKDEVAALKVENEKLEKRIAKLESFKNLVLSIGGGIGAIIGFMGGEITHRFLGGK